MKDRRGAAAYLGVSVRVIDEWTAAGYLRPLAPPSVLHPHETMRRKLYDVRDLDVVIDSWKASPAKRLEGALRVEGGHLVSAVGSVAQKPMKGKRS